jgi:hypothetical protein
MSIDLGDNPVGSTPTDAQKTQLRSSMGLGSSDTVEFGEVSTSQLNFPNLTTSEIDAVVDATEGDTYFDSDRGQFVRFTGSSSYDVVTVRSKFTTSSAVTSSTITLSNSGFLDAGLVTSQANPFVVGSFLTIKAGSTNIDGSGSSSAISYFYHDGSMLGSAGWYESGTLVASDNVSVPAGSLIQFYKNNETSSLQTNLEIVSSTSPTELVSEDLKAGSSYSISLNVPIADMLNGNVTLNSSYTGLYSEARALFSVDDIQSGLRLATFSGDLPTSVDLGMDATGVFSFDSPTIGYYTFTFNITPSSDGTWSFSASQLSSNALPLYVGRVDLELNKLTS